MLTGAAVAFAVLAWYGSTGAILWLNGLPRSTHPTQMALATVGLGIALCGIAASAGDTRVTGAYLAFSATLAVWGWQELGFLLGYVTGPRRVPCPADATGWPRVRHAVMAILWHELALLALFAAIVALTWRQPNPVALCTFGSLWVMRLSAKLNVFLGVRNLNEAFLPPHLVYMGSYFRHARSNALFPFAVIGGTGLAFVAWAAALHPEATAFGQTAAALVAALLSLAVLEHFMMVLPMPTEGLWRWGLQSREALPASAPAAAPQSTTGSGSSRMPNRP